MKHQDIRKADDLEYRTLNHNDAAVRLSGLGPAVDGRLLAMAIDYWIPKYGATSS